MKPIKLAPDLEKALLYGVITGTCSPEIINPDELSKRGKAIHGSVLQLGKHGRPPHKWHAVMLAATHLLGVEKSDIAPYIEGLKEFDAGSDIGAILRTARNKATLINLINRAGEQLASGDLRISDLVGSIPTNSYGESAKPFSAAVGKKWPKRPQGLSIPCFPGITEITRGLFGVWVIAGEPGLGKSTLAWQVALSMARDYPVLYYDLDGTGQEFFIDRTRDIYQDNLKLFKRRTRNIFFRHSASSLEEDLNQIKAPGVVFIDSVQTLPLGVRFAKETLDNWIRRFKEIAQKGFPVFCISEKQRAEYGQANLNGFKGSGDIEYAATVGAHLLGYEDNDDENNLVKFVIVKSRHSKRKGHVFDLERDEKRTFWWVETEPYTEDDNESPEKFYKQ